MKRGSVVATPEEMESDPGSPRQMTPKRLPVCLKEDGLVRCLYLPVPMKSAGSSPREQGGGGNRRLNERKEERGVK
jgi:hypothetical protein